MAGAQHGGKLLATQYFIGWFGGKRTDFSTPREGEGGFPRPFIGPLARGGGVKVLDSRDSQRRIDSARTISAPRKRFGAAFGEETVIDIAALGEAPDELVERRLALFCPAPFAQLAFQIAAQPGAGRRIALDIMEREPLQSLGIERRTR